VPERAERTAVLLFALARTAFCAYRAAVQSITVDEATTYLNYVRDHWANVWTHYDPNNHILYSILAQLSVRALHISEFSLRLPSVLAGFFFVIGVHRVLEATVGSRNIRWITLVAVSVSPLMLDFSVAARGYGLGVTLLVWAIYFSIRGRDLMAGIFAGLSMATTFNIAFSVIGLVACPLVLGTGRLRTRLRKCNNVAEPAALIVLAICYPAIRQARFDQFYVGLPTIHEALFDFVSQTVRAVPGHGGWLGSGNALRAIEYFLLPAVMLFVIAVSVRMLLREKRSRRALLPAFTLILALAAIVASHIFLGLNYPIDRLWLHLFVLFALAWAVAASQVPSPRIRVANAIVAVALIAQFLTQLHTSYFTLWVFDAPIKQIAQRVRDEVRDKPSGSLSLTGEWWHTPALQYYQHVYRLTALKPVERSDVTLLHGFDYYVLDTDAAASSEAHRLIPIYRDHLSGVLLAQEPQP
jgi:hypothetical protein